MRQSAERRGQQAFRLVRRRGGHGEHRDPAPAGAALEQAVQLQRGVLCRGQLAQQFRNEGERGQRRGIEVAAAEQQLHVCHAAGFGGMMVRTAPVFLPAFGNEGRERFGYVADREGGQRRLLFGGIRRFLPGLERREPLLCQRQRRFVHAGKRLLQPFGLGFGFALAHGSVRHKGDQRRIVCLNQKFPDQVGIVRGADLFAQGRQDRAVLQPRKRLQAEEHRVGNGYGALDALRLVRLLQAQLQRIDLRRKVLRVQPGVRGFGGGGFHGGKKGVLVRGLRIFEDHPRIGLQYARIHRIRHVLGQPRFKHGALYGSVVGAEKIRFQHLQRVHARLVRSGPGKLARGDPRLFFGRFGFADLVGRGDLSVLHRRLQRDLRQRFAWLKRGKVPVDQRQHRFRRHRAVQIDHAVGGMVEFAVGLQKPLVGEGRDRRRVAAGIEAVGAVRVQQPVRFFVQPVVQVAHGPLHFVIHHAVERGRFPVEIDAGALLHEDGAVLGDHGAEHRVQIYRNKVHEVFVVAARHRVHRFIRERKGVQEGVHGALDQIHKGLFYRILPRAAEHRMLQNMEHAGMVPRDGFERHRKHLVFYAVIQPIQRRAGFFVPQQPQRTAALLGFLRSQHAKAGDQVVQFQFIFLRLIVFAVPVFSFIRVTGSVCSRR